MSRRFTTSHIAYRTELVTPGGKILDLGQHIPADLPGLRDQFPFDGFEVRMVRITFPAHSDDVHAEIVEL
jgi:hypothetical protein